MYLCRDVLAVLAGEAVTLARPRVRLPAHHQFDVNLHLRGQAVVSQQLHKQAIIDRRFGVYKQLELQFNPDAI